MIMSPDEWNPDLKYGAWDGKLVYRWRQILKRTLMLQRGKVCDYCGAKLTGLTGCHMHEGIVTRGDTSGAWWQYKIFDARNCLLLCIHCHTETTPSREWAFSRLSAIYGADVVKDFVQSLPWKSGKPQRRYWS